MNQDYGPDPHDEEHPDFDKGYKKSIPVIATRPSRNHQARRLSGTKDEINTVTKSTLYRLAIAEVKRLTEMNLAYVAHIRTLQSTIAIQQEMLADVEIKQPEVLPTPEVFREVDHT